MTTRITSINLDGTIETKTTDTRTLKEKLNGELTFGERLELMYPTPNADKITKEWSKYDTHKFYK